MHKRKLWTLLSLLLVVSLLLAACGGDDDTKDEPKATEKTADTAVEETKVPPPTSAPDEKVTVRLLSGAVGQELELAQRSADEYMEMHPNVTIEIFDTPDAVQDRLGIYLQYFETQSAEADLYQIDVIWPGDLAEHLIDLNEYGAADVAKDHFPAIIENNTVDGRLVGIPWFTDAGLLYYRTDMLEKYGYDAPPATWTELEEMAKAIQEGERTDGNQDFWGFVWQGNAYEGLTCDALEWVYSNGGGAIISPDDMITINNPKAIEAINQAAAWVDEISPPGVTGFQEEDARNMWQAGNAAFMRNWPYAYSLGQADDSPVKDLFDVAPLPFGDSGRGAATLGGWQLAVSKYSKHPDIAADVALYLTAREAQKMRAITGSYNPTIMDLYEDPDVLAAAPFFGNLYGVFINAVARPSTATAPQYNEVSTLFFQAVHSVLMGDKDAQGALEELELDLEDLTGFDIGDPKDMPEPKTEPEPAPADGKKITLWHGWSGAYLEAIEEVFDEFNASNEGGIQVELSKVDDLSDALAVAVPAGEGPDILAWVQDQIGRNALAGNIVPIDEFVDMDFLEGTYEPAAVEAMVWNDQIWGLPESQEGIALIYNADLLSPEDLPADPMDFDDLLAKAQAWREANPDSYYLCNQGLGFIDAYHVAPIFFGIGGADDIGYVDADGNVYINNPEARVEAGNWILELSEVSPQETSREICQAMLIEGQAAVWWTGPWATADLEAAGVNIGLAPMGRPFVGIKVLMLTANGYDRDNGAEALEVMKYFTNAQVQMKLALINKTVPANSAALNDAELQAIPIIAGYGNAVNQGVPMPNHPFIDAQWGPVGDAVAAIWSGAQSVQEALDAAQELAETTVSEIKGE